MENAVITTINGESKTVNGIFYIFNSKYYFIYTLGELDGNEYVKLYSVQVGKEVSNSAQGPIETGNMIGVETANSDEWKIVQNSITQIVEDKKNNTQSSTIQYLPISMLKNLKIVSENKFKLLKNIIEDNFKLILSSQSSIFNNQETINNQNSISNTNLDNDVIIDYRSKFFEEQDKNKELEEKVKTLEDKIANIKGIIG